MVRAREVRSARRAPGRLSAIGSIARCVARLPGATCCSGRAATISPTRRWCNTVTRSADHQGQGAAADTSGSERLMSAERDRHLWVAGASRAAVGRRSVTLRVGAIAAATHRSSSRHQLSSDSRRRFRRVAAQRSRYERSALVIGSAPMFQSSPGILTLMDLYTVKLGPLAAAGEVLRLQVNGYSGVCGSSSPADGWRPCTSRSPPAKRRGTGGGSGSPPVPYRLLAESPDETRPKHEVVVGGSAQLDASVVCLGESVPNTCAEHEAHTGLHHEVRIRRGDVDAEV